MKTKTLLFCVFPGIALFTCLVIALIGPRQKNFTLDTPGFLYSIDRMSICYQDPSGPKIPQRIRNVFLYTAKGAQGNSSIDVSLIVKSANASYAVINGKQVKRGQRYRDFVVMSIADDAITIRYNSGSREVIHVKAY